MVELRSGRVLALRRVVMRRSDYCGLDVSGASPGNRYCGGYHEIAAARPTGGPSPVQPVPVIADTPARAAEPK